MTLSHGRIRIAIAAVTAAVAGLAVAQAPLGAAGAARVEPRNYQYLERSRPVAGSPSQEGQEALVAAQQFAQARQAPGTVAPGAYGAAFTALSQLPATGASWSEVTSKPYDSDDPGFRDPFYSNSSGGMGLVAGRITGLAVGGKHIYAGGADGGVFRSGDGGATWSPLTDKLPSLSVGDLRVAPDGALWLATGEANTGATSYVGSGVYRLADPRNGVFKKADRVGGNELESTMINKLKFDDAGNAYAATSRGLWRHSSKTDEGRWTNLLHTRSDPATTYDDIVNDVEIQPGSKGRILLANAAWRGGADYNGFYRSTDSGRTWARVTPGGDIVAANIGNAEFAFSANGKKLYAVVEDVGYYLNGNDSVLMGVFLSTHGVFGPWKRIADYRMLAHSGSALLDSVDDGYAPGVQAWYNNFVAVDPFDENHVFVGLEEVYETRNAGAKWKTIGPYWNFGFDCWSIFDAENTCPDTTHPDQHAVAFGHGRVYVGNDGGVYSAPRYTKTNANGNGTEWRNHNANLRTLQYYSTGTGWVDTDGDSDVDAADKSKGVAVFGGLQDNGGSLLLPTSATMVSPFGGDGGDSIVDPDNACNILDEYVFLTLWVTTNCGRTDGSVHAVTDVSVADPNPRFTAPFRADTANKDHWVAGGQYVWTWDGGFAIDSGDDWTPVYDTGDGRSITGLSSHNDVVWAGWCGGCNPEGFDRGLVTNHGGAWHQVTLPAAFPNRYISNVVIDTHDATGGTAYVVFNGFSRRWIEGPGAGVGHLWRTTDGGATWTDVSGNLPDVPASDLVVTPGGKLVLGTDLGVVISTDGGAHWKRVGGNHPYTTVMDLHVGPDGNLYSATHGRGIWKVPLPA